MQASAPFSLTRGNWKLPLVTTTPETAEFLADLADNAVWMGCNCCTQIVAQVMSFVRKWNILIGLIGLIGSFASLYVMMMSQYLWYQIRGDKWINIHVHQCSIHFQAILVSEPGERAYFFQSFWILLTPWFPPGFGGHPNPGVNP